LRLQIGFRHERLDLSRPPPGEEEENLTLLQLGATQEWHHTYRRPSLTLRLAPNFDFALNRGGGARSFVRPSLDATLHSRVPSGLEFDFHFLAGTVDRAVPAVEQWTLGGPTTVRGFREDAVLGRDLTALQSEIWIPFVRSAAARLPPAADEEDPVLPRFEPRAARFIRMALFVDGGTMARSAAAGSTALYGAGVGLRFVVPHQPLIVRIDYGWGLGVHGGDSFPYLSLLRHPLASKASLPSAHRPGRADQPALEAIAIPPRIAPMQKPCPRVVRSLSTRRANRTVTIG